MSKRRRVVESNPAEHLATMAWGRLRSTGDVPRRIVALKESRKCAVYRLEGIGPSGSIIAKRAKRVGVAVERYIHEQLLGPLGLATLGFYGTLDEGESDFSWLFLEDAGDGFVSEEAPEHRRLAVAWLGRLHTRSGRLGLADRLPDRGPNHYLAHLREARTRLLENRFSEAIGPELRKVVDTILVQLDTAESRWAEVAGFCDEMPQALVHGDFVAKNLLLRNGGTERVLLPLDWEEAGWGIPAADLANWTAEIGSYWSLVQPAWTHLDYDRIERMGFVGKLFRLVAGANWESHGVCFDWANSRLRHMQICASRLEQWLRDAGWDTRP